MVLGEGLLQDGHPEGSIPGKLVEGRHVDLLPVFPSFVSGDVVVDDHGVRNAQGVEVDSVDASRVHLRRDVQEDFLHALRNLSHSRASREKPAIPE